MARTWSRTGCGHGRGADMDWTRSRTGQGHGHYAGLWRGHSAAKPRPLRGRRKLRGLRSKACPREKPSGEGNKRRQMRISKGVIATNPLPHFVAICHWYGCGSFVGRMVKGMLSSENCPQIRAREPREIRLDGMLVDAPLLSPGRCA
jgi:hypothetical protein